MNLKKFIKLLLCVTIVTSCGDNGKPSERSQVYNIKDSDQVSIVNNENESSLTPPEIIDVSPQIEEKEETEKQIVEQPSKTVRTKKFYRGLLDGFCMKFFDRKFSLMHYVPGSINVESFSDFDSNTVIVKGTHSFRSPIILRNNKEFKAIVRDDGDNKFHIDFQRIGVRIGGIKSTGMLPFYYNPEE